MHDRFKQNQLPEPATMPYGEYEEERMPRLKWKETFVSKAGNPISPLFSWLSGETGAGYYYTSPEQQALKTAISNGQRNENALTDMLFFKRHPELGGRALSSSQPGFSTLSKEWLTIRDTLVRPALKSPSAPAPAPPAIPSVPAHGKLSLNGILTALQRKKYSIFQRPFELNIVGVRANVVQPNSFDDTITIFYKDATGNWQFRSCPSTTDPGSFYLDNPMNPGTGTAILKPGQYRSYQTGLHRNQYTALVQRAGPVTVIRDANRNNVLDFSGREETGYFGINIHRAKSSGTATTVDKFSAGCQVFANTEDFNLLIMLAKEHEKRYGNLFTYTLMTENDVQSHW